MNRDWNSEQIVSVASVGSRGIESSNGGKAGGLDYAAWHARLRSANTPPVGPVAEPLFLLEAEQVQEAPRRVA
jgi:hypothetical protein